MPSAECIVGTSGPRIDAATPVVAQSNPHLGFNFSASRTRCVLPLPAGPKTAPCRKLSIGRLANRAGVISPGVRRSALSAGGKGAATATGSCTGAVALRVRFGVGVLAPALLALALPLVFFFRGFFSGLVSSIAPPLVLYAIQIAIINNLQTF